MIDPLWRWKATYTTAKDQDRGRAKTYDGELRLWRPNNALKDWIVLRNAKGKPITGKYLDPGTMIKPGYQIRFSDHLAFTGNCLVFPPDSDGSGCYGAPGQFEPESISSSVLDCIKIGLDFSHGLKFSSQVKYKFGSTVHPLGKANHFLLVVSFGRSTFKISEDTVSMALESCIGGLCDDLNVQLLHDRVFRFSVSSRHVGFLVLALKSFACHAFECFFHTWGHGGPNWQKEFRIWQQECSNEWTLVSPRKSRTAAAMRALQIIPRRSILHRQSTPSKAKRSISFGSVLAYEACSGYEFPRSENSDNMQSSELMKVTEEAEPVIQFGTFGQISHNHSQASGDPQLAATTNSSYVLQKVQVQCNSAEHAALDDGLDGLSAVVDDIAFRFWDCSRCLSMGHSALGCTNKIRCRACYRYGHKEKDCFGKKTVLVRRWIPKKGKHQSPGETESEGRARYELDPVPWLPWGHQIFDDGPTRLSRTSYFFAQAPPQMHDSYCIAALDSAPPLAKEDLWRDQFPEIGGNIGHHQADQQQDESHLNDGNVENDAQREIDQVEVSMVVVAPTNSDSSVQLNVPQEQQIQAQFDPEEAQQGLICWAMAPYVPAGLQIEPFVNADPMSFDDHTESDNAFNAMINPVAYHIAEGSVTRVGHASPQGRQTGLLAGPVLEAQEALDPMSAVMPVSQTPLFSEPAIAELPDTASRKRTTLTAFHVDNQEGFSPHTHSVQLQERRIVTVAHHPIADTAMPEPQEQTTMVFQAEEVAAPPRARRARATPLVNNTPRMKTRSQTKLDGHKPAVTKGIPPQRKRTKKAAPANAKENARARISVRPPTPVPILQQLGSYLEIDPAILTAEKLNATPDAQPSHTAVSDD